MPNIENIEITPDWTWFEVWFNDINNPVYILTLYYFRASETYVVYNVQEEKIEEIHKEYNDAANSLSEDGFSLLAREILNDELSGYLH